MRPLLMILLLVIALGGAGVVYMTFDQSTPPQAAVVQTSHEREVLVAAEEIETGTLITPQLVHFAGPTDNPTADTVFDRVRDGDDSAQPAQDRKVLDEVTGAVARRRFAAGEPIIRGAVVKPGDSGFLAAVLSPGTRAITIGVTPVSGTGGLIYPGDRVDLILTQAFSGPGVTLKDRSVSETIASNVRVIAIDQQLQAKASPSGEGKLAQTVTLEVDPHTAESITVAAKLGDLSLTIRSLSEGAVSEAPKLGSVWAGDVSDAIREAAKRVVVTSPDQPHGHNITVIRGDKSDVVNVP